MTELDKFIRRCRNYSTGQDSAVDLLPAAALVMEELAASAEAYRLSIRHLASEVTDLCEMADLIMERLVSLQQAMEAADVE